MKKNEERLLKKYAVILTNEYIEEREIISFRSLLARSISTELRNNLNDLFCDNTHKITSAQAQKGLSWLLNQWKTPYDKERKNNPFGYREQNILNDFKCFYFTDTYNDSHNYCAAVYEVVSHKNTSFAYYINCGKVHIIG